MNQNNSIITNHKVELNKKAKGDILWKKYNAAERTAKTFTAIINAFISLRVIK